MPTTVPARSHKLIFFRWLRYLLTGFLGLLIALVCAGAIYEAIESHRDRLRFHPPGRMVDIGGYRLHLYYTGEGSPAVILEAGGENPWLSTRSSHKPRSSLGRAPTTAQDSDGAIPVPSPAPRK
jgi:hypothetical protein